MDIFNRMSLYGHLSEDQKEHLLLAALYNDLRLFEDGANARRVKIQRLFACEKGALTDRFSCVRIKTKIDKENWREQIAQVSSLLGSIPGTKPFERAFVMNAWLSREGLCPLIRYAFDQWNEIPSAPSSSGFALDDIADLSTTFLYRLIPVQETVRTSHKIGGGAYSNVYKSDDGKTAYKVPKNMASLKFASQDEHSASIFALNTSLAPFLPKTIGFDPTTGIIEREFIKGIAGFDLLKKNPTVREIKAIDQLQDLHRAAGVILEKSGINFDIHSGNMMWCEEKSRWILVDLGPMPKIGSDYFPRSSFKDYIQKIWIDVYRLMVDVPIRSLDIDTSPIGCIKIPSAIKTLCL